MTYTGFDFNPSRTPERYEGPGKGGCGRGARKGGRMAGSCSGPRTAPGSWVRRSLASPLAPLQVLSQGGIIVTVKA